MGEWLKEHDAPYEGIMAPDFCDHAMDEDEEYFGRMVDANHTFLWEEFGHYVLIDPISPKICKQVQKAHKRAAAKAASLATSSIDPSQIQMDKEEIGQTSQSETNSQAGATMENVI
ncbi:hypothetical protein L0F63_004337 [Massospora cicadina]|nr:hypothetical protein L0F63_004337 [Massospora cicadina]